MPVTSGLRALRRALPALVLATLTAAVLCAVLASLRATTYEATAKLSALAGQASTSPEEADRAIANKLVLAGGLDVARRAATALNDPDPLALRATVAVTQVPGTDVLAFSARDRKPARAQVVAEGFATAFSTLVADQSRQGALASADALTPRIDDLLAQLSRPAGTSDAQVTARSTLRDQYVATLRQQQDFRVQAALTQPSPVLESEDPPARVGHPAWLLGAVAGLLALTVGAMLVLVRARVDGVVRTVQDVGLPVADQLGLDRRRPPAYRSRGTARTTRRSAVRDAAARLCLTDPPPQIVAVCDVVRGSAAGGFVFVLGRELGRIGMAVDVTPTATYAEGNDVAPGGADDRPLESARQRRKELLNLSGNNNATLLQVPWEDPLEVALAAAVADLFVVRIQPDLSRVDDVHDLVARIAATSDIRVMWLLDRVTAGEIAVPTPP